MTPKQTIGSLMILIVLACTLLGVGGIWGFVNGDTAWQCFWTLVVVAIGLGTASGMIDVYFKDRPVQDLLGIKHKTPEERSKDA